MVVWLKTWITPSSVWTDWVRRSVRRKECFIDFFQRSVFRFLFNRALSVLISLSFMMGFLVMIREGWKASEAPCSSTGFALLRQRKNDEDRETLLALCSRPLFVNSTSLSYISMLNSSLSLPDDQVRGEARRSCGFNYRSPPRKS